MIYDVHQTFSYQFCVQKLTHLEALLHIIVALIDFCKQQEAYYHTVRKDEELSYNVKTRFISLKEKVYFIDKSFEISFILYFTNLKYRTRLNFLITNKIYSLALKDILYHHIFILFF